MSTERIWTLAQTASMSTFGRPLLISAAAGSGKTATLTERIIRRLTDPVNPVDLNRLLIVTYTRAAASELRERISAALSEAITRDPGNRHLQNQLINLGNAHISTIDAFCLEPVKTHFAELELPASSRIADDAELGPLCERIMGEIIDEFYIKYADQARSNNTFSLLWNNPFADLCDSLTPSKNDTELVPTLLNLYKQLLSFPEELQRLKDEAEQLMAESEQDFFKSTHGRILAEWLQCFCTPAIQTLTEALDDIQNHEAAKNAYSSAFCKDLEFCRLLAGASTYDEAFDLMTAYNNERLVPLRNADPIFVSHKDKRTAIVQDIKDLRKSYFSDPPHILADHMKKTAQMCSILYDLLSEYDHRITDEKKSRGICDFADNRRYLLSLLRNPDGTPSKVAMEFRQQFDEVYIDEYQDVDEMQDEIFRLVGDQHRFMVGDIKQSIYGFRGADPSVFARYRRELIQLKYKNNEWTGFSDDGNSIFMSENFRCDESVIRVTNAICGHILRACPHSVGYQDGDDLLFGKKSPDSQYTSPAVQISVLVKPTKAELESLTAEEANNPHDELSGAEAEATYVANEIAKLLRNRTPKANGEPIVPKDIVILMRSRTTLAAYMKALVAMGIPTGSEELEAAEAGKDILHGSDMSYLINLLRVVDNPDLDIPLSEVLRAPFPGLSLQELVTLRNYGDHTAESHSLFAGIEEYISNSDADPVLHNKLTSFIDWLNRYRRYTATQPADGILRLLKRDERCSCRETPAFLYLYETARSCKTSNFLSLYSFLHYFESLIQKLPSITLPEQSDDGGHVSIMTIHKSKGLEFPVCFLVRCGQEFSTKSYSKDLLFEKRAGASMKLYSRELTTEGTKQYKRDTTLRSVSALSIKLAEREEEMRVLYVAMTRARERLYMVGTGSDTSSYFHTGDRFATLSCNNYMEWIQSGLEAHPEIKEFYNLSVIPTHRIARDTPLSRKMFCSDSDSKDSSLSARYTAVLQNQKPLSPMEQALRHIPTKISASRVKASMLDHYIFYDTDLDCHDDKPSLHPGDTMWCDSMSPKAIQQAITLMSSGDNNEFELLLSQNRRPSPAERGTATHLFLQYCDYRHITESGIENEIARLTQQGFITARTAEILNRDMLTAYFSSDFFNRLCRAEHIERELRFTRFIPLSQLTTDKNFADLLSDRTLIVQGSIDLLAFYPDGHIELCDYKTDHITKEEAMNPSLLQARMTEAHRDQLLQYADAVEEMYGIRPLQAFIFSLPLGQALEIVL